MTGGLTATLLFLVDGSAILGFGLFINKPEQRLALHMVPFLLEFGGDMRIRGTIFLAAALSLYSSAVQACCSLYPAHFSDTIVYAGEAMKNGTLVHVLGYQNTAENRNVGGGNAMLLPIPAKSGTMTSNNILDTSECKNILKDMKRTVENMHRTRGLHMGRGIVFQGSPAVQIFDHDIYTIVLAQNAAAIPAALSQVPAAKRPAFNKEIFSAYSKWYPGYTFALCCFNTKDAAKANPMLWWYEPSQPNELFCPALDAHTGKAPRLDQNVDVDHVLAAGSHLLTNPMADVDPTMPADVLKTMIYAGKVGYSNEPIKTEVKTLLPEWIVGEVATGVQKNGDFVFLTEDVRKGVLKVMRKAPPGASK